MIEPTEFWHKWMNCGSELVKIKMLKSLVKQIDECGCIKDNKLRRSAITTLFYSYLEDLEDTMNYYHNLEIKEMQEHD